MGSIHPTASSLERVIACPDSHILPQVSTTGPHAERGTEIAKYIRAVVGGASRAAAAAKVPDEEWRATCLKLDFSRLVVDLHDVRGEIAYAIDVSNDTVRELGSNLGRNYPPTGPTEFVGTNDLEGFRIDRVPVAIDVKTGLRVTTAEDNAQLKFHCSALMLRTRSPEVEGRIAYVSEDGEVTVDCWTFTAFDLDCFGDDLRDLVRRVAASRERVGSGGPVRVASGSHCRYCPAMTACPQYTALARTMVEDLREASGPDLTAAAVKTRLAAMTPEEQARAWQKAKDASKLVEHVLDGLKAIAEQKPIEVNGQYIARVPWGETTRLDHEAALALLRAKGAAAEEIKVLYKTSPNYQTRLVSAKTLNRKRRAA